MIKTLVVSKDLLSLDDPQIPPKPWEPGKLKKQSVQAFICNNSVTKSNVFPSIWLFSPYPICRHPNQELIYLSNVTEVKQGICLAADEASTIKTNLLCDIGTEIALLGELLSISSSVWLSLAWFKENRLSWKQQMHKRMAACDANRTKIADGMNGCIYLLNQPARFHPTF